MSEILKKLKIACSQAEGNGQLDNMFIPKKMLGKCIFFSWREIVYEVSKLPNGHFKIEDNIIKVLFWFRQVQLEVGFIVRGPEESTEFGLYYIKKRRISSKFGKRLVEIKKIAKESNARDCFVYSRHYYKDRLNNSEYTERNIVLDDTFFSALETCRPCYMEHFKMALLLCSEDIVAKYGTNIIVVIYIRAQYEVENYGYKPYKIITMYPENKKKMGAQQ